MTTIQALKNLCLAEGITEEEIETLEIPTSIPDYINLLAGFKALKDTIVQSEKGNTTFEFTEYKVSQFQTGVNVADGAITGTLKYMENGLSPAGPLAGAGNFLALKFIDESEADSIKVGLVPSASGMGLVELDSDMNAVFKVTGEIEGVQQVLKVVTEKNGMVKTQVFDLTGLVLETE